MEHGLNQSLPHGSRSEFALRRALFVIAALFTLVISPPLTWSVDPSSSTDTAGERLPVGSWWVLNGSRHYAVSGSESYRGTWTRDEDYSWRLSVKNSDADTITLSSSYSESWSTTATDKWIKPNGGKSKSGTWDETNDYTIDAATLKIVAVSNKDYKDDVGLQSVWMTTPAGLTQGSTVLCPWYGKTTTEVAWRVSGSQTVSIEGINVNAWNLVYTGEGVAYWSLKDAGSTGTETITRLYDAYYGIALGWSAVGSYVLTSKWGGWTETYSSTAQITQTNLVFPVSVTVGAEPTDAGLTIDGAVYAGGQLPKIFMWTPSSLHELQVNATLQIAPGVRYVFMQWSDGYNDTSRTVTVSQAVNYTATFKTQYELKVVSDFGNPAGEGWYDSGSSATLSVTSPVPTNDFMGALGGKYVFDHWSGDATDITPTASVTMDKPRTATAEWRTDYTMPYNIIGAILATIAIVAALLTRRRREKARTAAAMTYPAQPAPPVPTARMAVGIKFCNKCGASLPTSATICIRCGSKQ